VKAAAEIVSVGMHASNHPSRRRFLEASALALGSQLLGQVPGDRPKQDAAVKVLNPRARVPVSIIIDDSTCLVNLNKFAIPQFAAVNPGKYDHYPWKSWPDEIPDSFVRKFADWADENGVKGQIQHRAVSGVRRSSRPRNPRLDAAGAETAASSSCASA
jgi:hypothetical protein